MQHGVLLIIAAASALASAASAAATLPPAWIENVARGRYMSTAATVADGLFPAVGNGYIAGDAGCSNVSADPSVKGGSCGRIHVAGVFSNGTYMDYNGTFPMRAAISNPFAVTVLTMHRWFDISAAETDLKYKPVIHFRDGWQETLEWFKANWLPNFREGKNNRMAGISKRTEDKIDLSAAGIAATKKKNNKKDA